MDRILSRRDFGSTIMFAAAAGPFAARAAGRRRPNIILIMADDLGYGHLGCYGQTLIRTPNLDRMAAEGMRFSQCYAGAPVCAPSRSALMTGLHGGHSPVRGNSGGIPLEEGDFTVAELLKSAGYHTGVFGKWGLGGHGTSGVPNKKGFDEFFGWLHQIHAHFYYPEYLWRNDERYPLEGNNGSGGQYAHDVVVEKAIQYLRKRAGNRETPFFLYVPLAVPHYELLVPEDSLREYRGRFPETPYNGRGRGIGYPLDYAAQPTPKAAIAAMIARMDRNVGRILDLLGELGLEEDTLVMFTSDNGPSYGPGCPEFFNASGGLRGVKATLYEGGIRVPAIARMPGAVPAGAVSDHPWYFPDLMPTFAGLAEAGAPAETDGVSILPTLFGRPPDEQPKHDAMYWEMDGARAVRFGGWKGIMNIEGDGERLELYDLESDPSERRNVADRHPGRAEQAMRLINENHTPPRPQIEPPKPEGRQYR